MSLHFSSFKTSNHFLERLWDAACIASIVGIWPRFIEPNLLFTSQHTLPIALLPKELDGLTIVQFSDLHYSSYVSKGYLDKISRHIQKLKPSLIVFTGDLLSYAELEESAPLQKFLSSLSAPLGCYAIFGNHDYKEYTSLALDGSYRIICDHTPVLLRGLSRIFSSKKLSNDPEVLQPIPEKEELKKIFADSGFQVLHNETVQIGKKGSYINLTGLGDICARQCFPNLAFNQTDSRFPSIVLSHNPDSYPLLEHYPGDLLLFGHTHGGQVNLPFIWEKITPLKNKKLKSGLVAFPEKERFLYINRGLGSTFPFRWFAPPEIAKITLARSNLVRSTLFAPTFSEEKGLKAPLFTSSYSIENE